MKKLFRTKEQELQILRKIFFTEVINRKAAIHFSALAEMGDRTPDEGLMQMLEILDALYAQNWTFIRDFVITFFTR